MVRTALRVALVLLILCAGAGYGAEKSVPLPASIQGGQPSSREVFLDDPLGRNTPYGTVFGFMKAVDREDYERAVEYLDTKQPLKRAKQLARDLQVILDRDCLPACLN